MPARLRGTVGTPAKISQVISVAPEDLDKVFVLRFDARVIQSRTANSKFAETINFWNDRSIGTGVIRWDGSIPALRLNVPSDSSASDVAFANQKVTVNTRYRSMLHQLVIDVSGVVGGTLFVLVGTSPTGSDLVASQALGLGINTVTFVPNSSHFYITLRLNSTSLPADAWVRKVEVVNPESDSSAGEVRVLRNSDSGTLASRRILDGTHTISFVAEDDIRVEFLTETEMWVDNVALVQGPLELPTNYEQIDLPSLQWTQSADVLYLAMQRFTPRKLVRYGDLDWSLAVFDPVHNPFSEAGHFPATVAFFDQRLMYGGTVAEPQSLWGSRVNDYENFILGTGDDDAMKITLSTGRGNQIITMQPMSDKLFVGTGGSEHIVTGSQQKVIGPKNLNLKRPSTYGTQPGTASLQLDTSAAFIERGGLRFRLVVYDFASDAFAASDLTLLADHLTDTEMDVQSDKALVEAVYQPSPYSVIWVRRKDGELLSVTFNKQQEVVAWARHRLGGQLDAGRPPFVRSIAVVPHTTKNGFQAWFVVDRKINGQIKRYIEYLGDFEGSYYTQLMVDSALVGNFEVPVSTVSGLGHLEGETVTIVGDGNTYPTQIVTGGQVTLDPPAKKVEVGLAFRPSMILLPIDLLSGDDSTAQLPRSIPRLFIDVRETLGIAVNGQTDIPIRDTANPMDQPPPLFNGTIEVSNIGISRSDEIEIEQTAPKPSEILALVGRINYGDR